MKEKQIIPMMFCFDKNYVIPAAVAFYSLLYSIKNNQGGGGIEYRLYVLHNDITDEQIQKLKQTISMFEFAHLEFIQTQDLFKDIWQKLNGKNHFSKEIFYKFLAPSFFPQYDKIIISDVDVIFLDDVKESFLAFDTNQKYYLAGVKMNDPDEFLPLDDWKKNYQKFTPQELQAVLQGIGAGYYIANLKLMRQDNIEQKLFDCVIKNTHKLVLAEQDALNIICYPHIYPLSFKTMVCTYNWRDYGQEWEKIVPKFYSQEEITQARLHPIQLHYAGADKPWKYPQTTKSDLWFYYILQTPFSRDFLNNLSDTIIEIYLQKYFLYRLLCYIKKNPFFVFKTSFYQKVFRALFKTAS